MARAHANSQTGQALAVSESSQLDKFKVAASELGTDDDPERFKERVRKVGSAKVADPGQPERRR